MKKKKMIWDKTDLKVFILCLLDEIVVSALQQIFKVDQMLQVSQELHLSPM